MQQTVENSCVERCGAMAFNRSGLGRAKLESKSRIRKYTGCTLLHYGDTIFLSIIQCERYPPYSVSEMCNKIPESVVSDLKLIRPRRTRNTLTCWPIHENHYTEDLIQSSFKATMIEFFRYLPICTRPPDPPNFQP